MSNNCIIKQKGIILPVVLIFFSVLMLLGVSFVSMSGFQAIQSESQVDRSQAYHLAKSGAVIMTEQLINMAENQGREATMDFLNDLISKPHVLSIKSAENKAYDVIITIEKNDSDLKIKSTATINKVESTMYGNLKVTEVPGNSTGEDVVEIITIGTVKAGITIVGPNSTQTNAYKDLLKKISNVDLYYGTINEFPVIFKDYANMDSLDKSYENSNVDSSTLNLIDKDMKIKTLNINSTLTIDLKNETRIIVVDDLNVKPGGNIIYKNIGTKGQVFFQINRLFDINSNNSLVLGREEDNKLLQIFINSSATLDAKNATLYGNIFINNGATIRIAQHFNTSGLIYAPMTSIQFGNNSKIKSSIVAKDLSISPNTVFEPTEAFFDVIQKVIDKIQPKFEIFYDQTPWN